MELPGGRRIVHTSAMTTLRPGEWNDRGTTVLEACAALALCAAAAVSIVEGIWPLACAVRVEAARHTLVDALLEARRTASETEASAAVELEVGASSVALRPSGASRVLGDGVAITGAPSDGDVTFRGTGLADNATVAFACGAASASVVVNQRGVIR